MKPIIFNQVFLSDKLPKSSDEKSIKSETFNIKINRVGLLSVSATVTIKRKNFQYPEIGKPFITTTSKVPWKLYDPIGNEFTKSKITLEDLNKYRNPEGYIRKWKLVTEKSGSINDLEYESISGLVSVKVTETIPNISAEPLVDSEVIIGPSKEFEFDLYRLGEFKVWITHKLPIIQTIIPSIATIKLIRPDGSIKKSGQNGFFTSITPADIKNSRGANGEVKKWKIRIESSQSGKHKVFCQMYETLSISKSAIMDRLNYLLGPNGENFEFKIKYDGSKRESLFNIKINNPVLAENLELYDVFGKTPEKHTTIDVNKDYILYKKHLGNDDCYLRTNDFTLDSLKITVGESVESKIHRIKVDVGWQWPPIDIDFDYVTVPKGLPKLAIELNCSNTIDIVIDHSPNINGIKISKITLQIAFDTDNLGNLKCWSWIEIDSNVPSEIEKTLLGLAYAYIIEPFNNTLSDICETIFGHMLAGLFKLTNTRYIDSTIKIDYVAGVIPEAKPLKGYMPSKGFGSAGLGIIPTELKNTWKSPLLTDDPDKIKHIIVLMMENRSFDHVLGYLSLKQQSNGNIINPKIDGLTEQVVADFSDDMNKIRHLAEAQFPSNAAGLKTELKANVGHSFEDIKQQIDNGTMKGFVENFIKKNPNNLGGEGQPHSQDVLGYYTEQELAMYRYLADEYTICDNYFSSHPGLTLPNRMFSLMGDLKKDRNGEPIKSNHLNAPFFFCREQTIFDILDQHEVSWRVYESLPSVATLRLFSKYAGDNTHIRDIKDLEADIWKPDFPSVVFVEPAMHEIPANDDHPPADMLRGQHFVKNVYKALRANENVWNHCLFAITYDEHGGFFDHVSPIVAEVFHDPKKLPIDVVIGDVGGSGPGTTTEFMDSIPNIYGVRVPTFLISPYVKKGGVYKKILDHTSILKTILIKFCGKESAFLSDRTEYAFDFGGALTENRRTINSEPPSLPSLFMRFPHEKLVAMSKIFKKMTKKDMYSEEADFHEFISFIGRMTKPIK